MAWHNADMSHLQDKYHRLDLLDRTLLQILAFQRDDVRAERLCVLAKDFGLKQSNGRALTISHAREAFKRWAEVGLLTRSSSRLEPELMDRLIRDGLAGEDSQRFRTFLDQKTHFGYRPSLLDFYFAFYSQDVETWRSARRGIPDSSVPLLEPFCQTTFDQLTPEMQTSYFSFVLPTWINQGNSNQYLLHAWRRRLEDTSAFPEDLLPRLLEWALSSGDRQLLERIQSQVGSKMQDVEGCRRLLAGELDAAFKFLAVTLTNRATKQALTRLGGLPSLLAILSAIAGRSEVSREQAFKETMMALKPNATPYSNAFAIAQQGLMFLAAPSNAHKLLGDLNRSAETPLSKWVAGYLQAWLAPDADQNTKLAGLDNAATALMTSGCLWLAAETHCAAARSKSETASVQREEGERQHAQCRTSSLIDLVQPQPAWERALHAIALLGSKSNPKQTSRIEPERTDRLIFEIWHNNHEFHLDAYHQVRKGDHWSTGRKIALSRLYHKHADPEFSFLTPEDLALCKSLRHSISHGSYGYPEEDTKFEPRSGAQALIGHPRIFCPKDRSQPLEIMEKPVVLIVRQTEDSQIELLLDPQPDLSHSVQFQRIGPNQISVTFFDPVHQNLKTILRDGLRAPLSGASKVLESVTQLASIVTVHSEIGDIAGDNPQPEKKSHVQKVPSSDAATKEDAAVVVPANKVVGDPRPQLHLIPLGDGLRAEFYVQPFGATGPMCRPGEGGSTLFATIDSKATSANRDLVAEVKNAQTVIDRCESIANHLAGSWSAAFPSQLEALELLLELEPLAQNDVLTVQWPKGRSLRLVGQSNESMMKVRIRRDGNWFAASGELKFAPDRSIEMMQLLELVSASPGRFVKLGDGEFLALTNSFRQRLDDLRMLGDHRSSKGHLRFGAVHAGVLEDLGGIKITADAHWKKCLQRMKEAISIDFHVPETFQAELRLYQQEGIAWMQRLAAWGVGGCLADDMGLGKTIQAIAVLLQRANEGPAIVIAPTSVIHNWHDEIARFAPTLQPRILAESSRTALLDSLAARDVLLCSYGLMQNEIKNLAKINFNTLFLDEAQAIKNTATQRSQAAKQLKSNCRFLLTGTPLENHLSELWNLMDFINPGLLGDSESFQQRFAIPIERDGDRAARQALKRLVAPFMLRRTKSQVLSELPSRTETTLRINPSEEEAAFYEAVRLRAIEKLANAENGKASPLQILGEIMRLRRACCHPKLVVPDINIDGSKLAQVLETIDELREGKHRALIFSQFVDHLQLLRDQLDQRGISYQYLDGSTPARERKVRVEAFQSGQGDVFLISLKAGGTGLNLTAADYVIHLDPWWNPAVEDQASDRAHRIGQQRPVTIYRMILAGTIEEKILALHATKRDLAESLLEGSEQSGKLTTEELLRLIKS